MMWNPSQSGVDDLRAVWNEGRTFLCRREPATHATPLGAWISDN